MTPSKTPFAGLEALGPGDPLSADGYAFQTRNPVITDFLLRLGALLHRHDAHAPMVDPSIAPVLAALATGGTIDAALTIYVAYTLTDPLGGETLPTDIGSVTTDPGYEDPTGAPDVALSFAAGTLLASSPMYAVSVTDGLGGETALGPVTSIDVPPAAHAEVLLSGLGDITDTASAHAAGAGWRLWRSMDGANSWALMATGAAATDTWVDDGTSAGDCTVAPLDEGTTGGECVLHVTVPGGQPAEATFFNLYACTDGLFLSPCLLGTFPVADLGVLQSFTALSLTDGQPPSASTCIGGANQINLDTDISNNPWKSRVASAADLPLIGNGDGDVRVVVAVHLIYMWNAGTAEWTPLSGGPPPAGGVDDGGPGDTGDTIVDGGGPSTTTYAATIDGGTP